MTDSRCDGTCEIKFLTLSVSFKMHDLACRKAERAKGTIISLFCLEIYNFRAHTIRY